jgi:hypothetical protein
MGLNCARVLTKWTNSEIKGTWTLGYYGFMNDVKMRKGEWMPQPRASRVALTRNEGHQG